MTELALDRDQRLALKAQAHALKPVVLLGTVGLTEAVLAEIDRALASHGLIKIRIPTAEREAREAMFVEIATRLAAARVQSIGKLAVLFRPLPEDPASEPASTVGPGSQRKAGAGAKRDASKGAGSGNAGRQDRERRPLATGRAAGTRHRRQR